VSVHAIIHKPEAGGSMAEQIANASSMLRISLEGRWAGR
jgi:hypothetical protein